VVLDYKRIRSLVIYRKLREIEIDEERERRQEGKARAGRKDESDVQNIMTWSFTWWWGWVYSIIRDKRS
jgi:hypothetical protein